MEVKRKNYARLLDDQDKVEHFLTKVLNIDTTPYENIHYSIVNGESGIVSSALCQTIDHTEHRDRKYKGEEAREALRKQIIDELMHLPLLENDDAIELGNGGCYLPNLKKQKNAFILIGLPASGKSSVAQTIARDRGALILDSDFAKRKLPEYKPNLHGATLVHEESIQIIFGFKNQSNLDSLYEKSIKEGYNIVIPKIGNDPASIIRLAERLTEAGYKKIHLTLISLPKELATERALGRFNQSKRYVPLSMIFDHFGNDPILTYYLIKNNDYNVFHTFGAISTNVPINTPFKRIDLEGNNPAKLYKYDKKILI